MQYKSQSDRGVVACLHYKLCVSGLCVLLVTVTLYFLLEQVTLVFNELYKEITQQNSFEA